MLSSDYTNRNTLIDFDKNIDITQNYINWKYRITENLTFVHGIHNLNVHWNSKSTLENRSAISWKFADSWKLNAGFGNHSMMESVHHYFTRATDSDGKTYLPNADLDLLKADHFVLGIEKKLSSNIRFKMEAYYQELYNIPVAKNQESAFSTLNEDLDFQYLELVNEGTGKNYGLEFTIERYFQNNYYYLANLSIFESKFTSLDGIERDTRFNGKYIANFLFGKEFPSLGKNDNQSLTLNLKAFVGGAKPTTPLLRDESGNLLVDPANNQFYDHSKEFEYRLDDLYQITLSASYKWNKKKATHELFINLDNLTNTKGKISEYYDVSESDSVGNLTQFGIFPNLMYRVYF